MMKTNLPPQAYTREVFASAYEWLQTQSKSIQELAQTPDDLVALYLQARRHGHLKNTGSSGKSFQSDLKNLAEGLRQFDDRQSGPSASAVTEKVTETTKHSVTFSNPPPPPQPPLVEDAYKVRHNSFEPALDENSFDDFSYKKSDEPIVKRPSYEPPRKEKSKKNLAYEHLDKKSQKLVQKAREELNLSQESEALRMLIVLGKEKLKEILPEE